jgi:hypothetical protein
MNPALAAEGRFPSKQHFFRKLLEAGPASGPYPMLQHLPSLPTK